MLAALEPIVQKNVHDCLIACLAMVLGRPYVEVHTVAQLIVKDMASGLTELETKRVAKALGFKLRAGKPPEDFDDETGILILKGPHAVVIFSGALLDPASGLLYVPDAYFSNFEHLKFTPDRFLKVVS